MLFLVFYKNGTNSNPKWSRKLKFAKYYPKSDHNTFDVLGSLWKFAKFVENLTIFSEFSKISENVWDGKKCRDHFSDNIIVHNVAKFQPPLSFWTWVIFIFLKYQKKTIFWCWIFLSKTGQNFQNYRIPLPKTRWILNNFLAFLWSFMA